jgi:transposase-like protein
LEGILNEALDILYAREREIIAIDVAERAICSPPSPNAQSCLRLMRALAVGTHENWIEAHRYLNMDDLKELKKADLRKAA